jgi:hypothetical protein
MNSDPWTPERYLRLAEERAAPSHDLLALVGELAPGGLLAVLLPAGGPVPFSLRRILFRARRPHSAADE